MKIPFKRILRRGDCLPKFYGVAYYLPHNLTLVAYPFPFNHIIGYVVWFWHKIRDTQISI